MGISGATENSWQRWYFGPGHVNHSLLSPKDESTLLHSGAVDLGGCKAKTGSWAHFGQVGGMAAGRKTGLPIMFLSGASLEVLEPHGSGHWFSRGIFPSEKTFHDSVSSC